MQKLASNSVAISRYLLDAINAVVTIHAMWFSTTQITVPCPNVFVIITITIVIVVIIIIIITTTSSSRI